MNRILSIAFASGLVLSLQAQTTRVLFIGNSYTSVNDLPEMTRQLALSLGDTLIVANSSPGGYTFQQHTANDRAQGTARRETGHPDANGKSALTFVMEHVADQREC